MSKLDKILAGFTKTSKQLSDYIVANNKRGDVITGQVVGLHEELDVLDTETQRAQRIISKIEEIVK